MKSINKHLLLLKEKYEEILYENKKNPLNILNFIHEKFNLIELDQTSTTISKDIELTKLNCLYALNNTINMNDLNIIAFEILRDQLSEKYYEEFDKKNLISSSIKIIFETTTGYFNSNDDTIVRELILFRGVNQYDIDNNTADLSLYLRLLDELMN